jgi:hypothetical protein
LLSTSFTWSAAARLYAPTAYADGEVVVNVVNGTRLFLPFCLHNSDTSSELVVIVVKGIPFGQGNFCRVHPIAESAFPSVKIPQILQSQKAHYCSFRRMVGINGNTTHCNRIIVE